MKWLQGAVAVLLLGSAAYGQAPPPTAPAEAPPNQEAAAAEIAELKAEITELNRKLDALWARYDQDQQEATKKAEEKAETTPKVSIGSDGLKVSSPDGAFESRIGLRLMHDWAWFNQDDSLENFVVDENDGTGFRNARIILQGKVFSDIQYQMEMDFAGENGGDTPKFRDVFLQYNGIPYFTGDGFDLRVGHFKEPFSLEELNSSPDRPFQENPLLDTLVPSRNAGIMLSDALIGEPKKERLFWQIGAFKETDDIPSSNDSDEDQGYQVTGRVAGLPYYARDGRHLLHLGAAYSLRNPDGAALPYGVRPETRLSVFRYANPEGGILPALYRLSAARPDDVNLLGLEMAGIFGPFSFQSEYVRSDIETTFGGDLTYDGWYASAGYVLTGENRVYKHDVGRIARPVPDRPLALRGDKRGWGAWEVQARYSSIDLSDGPIPGGEHEAFTLGLNWYLNKNVAVIWNYIHNEVDHPFYDGGFDVLQTRFQIEF